MERKTVEEGGGWIGECKSADPLWFITQILRQNFVLKPKSQQKYFMTCKVQNPTPQPPRKKNDESVIHCNWRISRSVKSLLWIRNSSKNTFKTRRSVGLFNPLFERARLKGATEEPGRWGGLPQARRQPSPRRLPYHSLETEEVVLLGYKCQQMKVNSLWPKPRDRLQPKHVKILIVLSFQIWNHYDVYREGYLEKKQLRVSLNIYCQ